MKSIIAGITFIALLTSCGSTKKVVATAVSQAATANVVKEVVAQASSVLRGVEMVDVLSDNGVGMIQIPYQWFGGIGKAATEQEAISLAQKEAGSSISNIINGLLSANSSSNSVVQQALSSYWKQLGRNIARDAQPFGEVEVKKDPTDGLFTAIAKVAIDGDLLDEKLCGAEDYKPAGLSGDDLNLFGIANKAIIAAIRGK